MYYKIFPSRIFKKKINFKYLIIPFISCFTLYKGKSKLLCRGDGEDDDKKSSKLFNHKLAKIEQKLDFLLQKENYKIELKDFPRLNKQYADSILHKVLDENTWRRNHMLNTEEGFNINDIIQPGLDNQDHPLGLVAPSKDSYYTFDDILVSAASLIHNRNIRLNKYERENIHLIKNLINTMEDFLISINCEVEITTSRNLEGYVFSSKISRSNRREIARNILHFLKSQELEIFEEVGKFLSLEKAFQSSSQNPFYNSCGFYRDWPDGRFIFVNNQNTLNIIVNEEDHIKLIQKSDHTNAKHLLNYFELLEKLNTQLNFVYDENLGYLTSLPSNLGSSSYFKLKIKIPTQRLEEFKNHFKNITEVEVKLITVDNKLNDDKINSIVEISNVTSYYNFSQILIEFASIKDLFKI